MISICLLTYTHYKQASCHCNWLTDPKAVVVIHKAIFNYIRNTTSVENLRITVIIYILRKRYDFLHWLRATNSERFAATAKIAELKWLSFFKFPIVVKLLLL